MYRQSSDLVAGSGLFVGRQGIATEHHFMMRDKFAFKDGEYRLEVYAKAIGKHLRLIHSQSLSVGKREASRMHTKGVGVYFDWMPDREEYDAYVREGE